MALVRKSSDRGHFDFGWLDTHHTFSFGRYVDRQWMGFSVLRVINDDLIAPGAGFGEHPHDNMEIISYIVAGKLAHRDTLGNVRTISPGEVQAMSAGTGLEHSEFNPSTTERTRLIQVWVKPARPSTAPGYDQRMFAIHSQPGRLHLLVSPDGSDQSLRIGQDACMWAGVFHTEHALDLPVAPGRRVWVQVVGGRLSLGEHVLEDGDGAALTGDERPLVKAMGTADAPCHVLIFDLP